MGIISKAELARKAKVSPGAVTALCKGKLKSAMRGDRIDEDSTVVRNYLALRVRTPPGAPTKKPKKPVPTPERRTKMRPATRAGDDSDTELDELEPDLSIYDGLTLREIWEKHNNDRRFKDLLEARVKISNIQQRELDMSIARGALVSRDFIQLHVIGSFATCNRRLLSDAAKTLARRLYAAAKAGEPIEVGERIVTEIHASHLDLAVQQAIRALQDV